MPSPTAPTHARIDHACRRFTEATGWRLEFRSHETDGETDSCSASVCWSRTISSGDEPLGRLSLATPEAARRDQAEPPLAAVAELLADLLAELEGTSRSLESRTRELSTLVDVGLSVTRDDDVTAAIRRLLEAVVQLTGLRTTGFFLLDGQGQRLNLKAEHSRDGHSVPHPLRSLNGQCPDLAALARRKVLLQRDRNPATAAWLPEGASTGVCLPVLSNAGPIGTLWAFDRRLRQLTRRELHVLQSIAAQLASVLERAVLLRESASQQRLQRELETIGTKPDVDPISCVGDRVGFEIAGLCGSHFEVGGDLCDVVSLPDGRTLLAVGDASGDSVPAALVMCAARGALHTLLRDGDPPSTEQIVATVNDVLHRTTPAHQFMSLVVGVVDPNQGTFTFTNAGHPNPLHVRGDDVFPLESHGLLLGVTESMNYRATTISVASGDVLVLYSDGISEAMSGGRRMFRTEGIAGAVQQRRSQSAHDVLHGVLHEVRRHTDGAAVEDDHTLLVVRFH